LLRPIDLLGLAPSVFERLPDLVAALELVGVEGDRVPELLERLAERVVEGDLVLDV
jgi:hypothetical protein